MIKNIVCVSCPLGCPIEVAMENGEVVSVKGNTCKRGDAYARTEMTAPKRSLTSTVKVSGGKLPVVSVKSSTPLPKELMLECMSEINRVTVKAPVKTGDVVIENILNTGVDIVATNND
ncbi:MAG: DUF1667 domain-containing protein [Clostridiales bacterium]|nr:DUF1667 domain-containing protein [Clostridiales bacterium]